MERDGDQKPKSILDSIVSKLMLASVGKTQSDLEPGLTVDQQISKLIEAEAQQRYAEYEKFGFDSGKGSKR
ncbi:hypothetical protein AYI68_g4282 [Smittium mucronatum]|uniref:Uncharacterized protein n=1 Tax=Smittium mucronatum TaxID=133383 RepID=A0A1R0GXI7_9FUNG|nr:hypothetical protein AYI68_g4282 [Smittium mucronatum]